MILSCTLLLVFGICFVFSAWETSGSKKYYNSNGNFYFSVFAHYMPWFQYPDNAYHWPPQSGMYYTPLVGYYSSQNETVIEWQLELMNAVGINGVIVDWYGVGTNNDYPFIKESTELLWNKILQYNMTLGICYDINSSPDSQTAIDSMTYLNEKFFSSNNYMTDMSSTGNKNPIVLIWPSYNSESLMNQDFWLNINDNIMNKSVIYEVEYLNPAWSDSNLPGFGKFGWIYPQNKDTSNEANQISEVLSDISNYYSWQFSSNNVNSTANKNTVVGSVYKGFSDHYVSGGTDTTNPYNSIGLINADYSYLNKTWHYTFENIFLTNNNNDYNYYILQIPTWNDYTEGTIIEPHVATSGCEYGCQNGNPYVDLLDIYQLIANYSGNTQPLTRDDIQTKLEQITQNVFNEASK